MEEMQKAFNKTIIKLQNTSRIAEEQVSVEDNKLYGWQRASAINAFGVALCGYSNSDMQMFFILRLPSSGKSYQFL